LLFVFALSNCKKSSNSYSSSSTSSAPPTNEVWIQNMAFNPSTITVTAGTTIKWTNKDNATHTVTSNSSLFDSGNISNGNTYSHQFATTGSFPYHCSIHSSMTATVVVN
jgi:plastocyanin